MFVLTLKSRLIIALLFISVFTAGTLLYIGYFNGEQAIRDTIYNQLSSIRSAKQSQIESYFLQTGSLVETLGENDLTALAIRDFKKGFAKIHRRKLSEDQEGRLGSFYDDFVSKLSKNLDVEPNSAFYIPTTKEGRYLQQKYIIDNPNPLGQKDNFTDAADGTFYSKTHQKYHRYFLEMVKKQGFYDLFLVDFERGDIVYSVYKETEFATNLFYGPYRESNMAKLVRRLRENSDVNTAEIIDFANYRPSYGAPASFIGIPVRDRGVPVGALVVQLPVDEVNEIMTDNEKWEERGFGKSGESFLVAEDKLMRSISRFYLQDTIAFKKELTDQGDSVEEVEEMYEVGSTILRQKIKSGAIDAAFRGESGVQVDTDYRGVEVLSSFSKLDLLGLNWAIMSNLELSEAMQPVEDFKHDIFNGLGVIILLVTFIAMIIASKFVKPIVSLSKGIEELEKGNFDHQINVQSDYQFGVISRYFNKVTNQLGSQKKIIDEQTTKYDQMMLNFIPASIVKKIKKGDKRLASKIPNVSLVLVDVVGFSELVDAVSSVKAFKLFNGLIEVFDAAANRHQIEKIRTVGDSYFATCGLHHPEVDHTKKVMNFALSLKHIIHNFNVNHNVQLDLQITLHTGVVTEGVFGIQNYRYDLLGTTVAHLYKMGTVGANGNISVSTAMKIKLEEFHQFDKKEFSMGAQPGITIWQHINDLDDTLVHIAEVSDEA